MGRVYVTDDAAGPALWVERPNWDDELKEFYHGNCAVDCSEIAATLVEILNVKEGRIFEIVKGK